jgi:hypothetical protein
MNGVTSDTTDIVLSAINLHEPFKNVRIGDSRASCNYFNSDKGLFDKATISEMITVGNGSIVMAEKVGKLRSYGIQCYGRIFKITVENVKIVPEFWIILFSINKALMNVFMIGNEGVLIKLTKGETTLVFDQSLNIRGVFVSGIKMVTVLNKVANTVVETKNIIKTVSVETKKIQKILGHRREIHSKATANAYGIKVFRKLEACESCAMIKERQTKTSKVWNVSSNVPGERLYVNFSLIKGQSFGGAKFWALIVDDCNKLLLEFFC